MDTFNEGRYLDALKEFTMLLEKNRDDAKSVNDTVDYINKIFADKTINYTDEFISWLRHEADAGNSFAQNNMGFMYRHGIGLTKDSSQAISWYKSRCDLGNMVAAYNLACAYSSGDGVIQDDDDAFKFYQMSASKGYVGAIINLGYTYFEKKYYLKALKSFEDGHKAGLKDAAGYIRKIFKKMNHDSSVFEEVYQKYIKCIELEEQVKNQQKMIEDLQSEMSTVIEEDLFNQSVII